MFESFLPGPDGLHTSLLAWLQAPPSQRAPLGAGAGALNRRGGERPCPAPAPPLGSGRPIQQKPPCPRVQPASLRGAVQDS